MNWALLRMTPWLDTRARFVASVCHGGRLLDLGSSDGETLRHFAELRPDLALLSVDIEGTPDRYPTGCEFVRADLEADSLPWPVQSIDAITCMHLVEHLNDIQPLLIQVAQLLRIGGNIYIETPHPKTVNWPSARGSFTLNFNDDPTHVKPVPVEEITSVGQNVGLRSIKSGISRNWLFTAAWPVLFFAPKSRQRFTAQVHWGGWSSYVIMEKPK